MDEEVVEHEVPPHVELVSRDDTCLRWADVVHAGAINYIATHKELVATASRYEARRRQTRAVHWGYMTRVLQRRRGARVPLERGGVRVGRAAHTGRAPLPRDGGRLRRRRLRAPHCRARRTRLCLGRRGN